MKPESYYVISKHCRMCDTAFEVEIERGFPADLIAGMTCYCPRCRRQVEEQAIPAPEPRQKPLISLGSLIPGIWAKHF